MADVNIRATAWYNPERDALEMAITGVTQEQAFAMATELRAFVQTWIDKNVEGAELAHHQDFMVPGKGGPLQ